MPHQKHLALGISGDIKTQFVRWRSKQETSEAYFPRIESARDSLGNIWVPSQAEKPKYEVKLLDTGLILRVGDQIDFLVTASDPQGELLEYDFSAQSRTETGWQTDSAFSLLIEERHIASLFMMEMSIRSLRSYHAKVGFDDQVTFIYTVLPKQ